MRRPRTKPWVATGHGSYRVLRPGVCQLRFRPGGVRGPEVNRIAVCTPAEARACLLRHAAERTRSRVGLELEPLTW
jgi:hypothetical protein